VVDVYAGVDDSRNTVRLGAEAVVRKLPQPEAMLSEITVDAVVKLFFYEGPKTCTFPDSCTAA
jgi:hypothetical protein